MPNKKRSCNEDEQAIPFTLDDPEALTRTLSITSQTPLHESPFAKLYYARYTFGTGSIPQDVVLKISYNVSSQCSHFNAELQKLEWLRDNCLEGRVCLPILHLEEHLDKTLIVLPKAPYDLFDYYIRVRKSEIACANVYLKLSQHAYHLVNMIGCLHAYNHIHGDIKPENILCVDEDANQIRLSDFDTMQFVDPSSDTQILKRRLGTYSYSHPLMLQPGKTEVRLSLKAHDWFGVALTLISLFLDANLYHEPGARASFWHQAFLENAWEKPFRKLHSRQYGSLPLWEPFIHFLKSLFAPKVDASSLLCDDAFLNAWKS